MAQCEQIEERLISGTGVLRVPVAAVQNRMSILYLSVIRPPRSRYLNNNWNPPRGKYAFLTYLRNGYVIGTADMEFERQSYDGVADIAGQTLIAVKCAYEGILISFANLGTALNLNVVSVQDLIKDYENLNLAWDEVRIKCYADTAVQARLFRLVYDTCNPDKDDQRKPPPPTPPLPPVPPGTPIGSISPPYDRFTNDNNTTQPYPGDETEGTADLCENVRVYVQYDRLLDGNVSRQAFDFTGKATVDNVYIAEIQQGGSSIFVIDRTGSSNTCSPTPVTRRVNRGLGTWSNLSWYAVRI